MKNLIYFVLIVDSIIFIKIFGSVIRAKINKEKICNSTLWTRIGFLIVFHSIMFAVAIVTVYTSAIVTATL